MKKLSTTSAAIYMRKWYLKNKKKFDFWNKRWKDSNPEKAKEIKKRSSRKFRVVHPKRWAQIKKISDKKYRYTHPWVSHCNHAEQRCNNPNKDGYKRYGGRGIKFLMTQEEFKTLWFRDKAYEMKEPSIDRIDNDGNYELTNCRFIELTKNIRRKGE